MYVCEVSTGALGVHVRNQPHSAWVGSRTRPLPPLLQVCNTSVDTVIKYAERRNRAFYTRPSANCLPFAHVPRLKYFQEENLHERDLNRPGR